MSPEENRQEPDDTPVDQGYTFLVFIIESPAPEDIRVGRQEGDILLKVLNLAGIKCAHRIAIDKQNFHAAIYKDLSDILEALPQDSPPYYPIIHVSAHGDEHGIELTSGEMFTWDELGDMLRPANVYLGNSLLLCLSSCSGFFGGTMICKPGDYPFRGLVSNLGKPAWQDTAIAFAVFYHQIIKGASVEHAIDAMRIASGDDHFMFDSTDEMRKSYLEHLIKNNQHELVKNFIAGEKPPPPPAPQK